MGYQKQLRKGEKKVARRHFFALIELYCSTIYIQLRLGTVLYKVLQFVCNNCQTFFFTAWMDHQFSMAIMTIQTTIHCLETTV